MNQPRFIPTRDYGLVLETPVPLSPVSREAIKNYAIAEYKRRLKSLTGDRREAVVRVIEAIQANNFTERAIPMYDSSVESILL